MSAHGTSGQAREEEAASALGHDEQSCVKSLRVF